MGWQDGALRYWGLTLPVLARVRDLCAALLGCSAQEHHVLLPAALQVTGGRLEACIFASKA